MHALNKVQVVSLFVDYQNMFRRALDLYHDDDSRDYTAGHFWPDELAELICSRPPEGFSRVVGSVRVYTGQPDSTYQPRSYGAHRKQTQAWRERGITLVTRALRYPREWPDRPAQEKGIDVALAIDYVALALDGKHDVGVIASTDTDLLPAIEFVFRRCPGVRAEVTSWGTSDKRGSRLSIPGKSVWCHWLREDDYYDISDPTDYLD